MVALDLTMTPGLHPVVAQTLATVDFGRIRFIEALQDLSPEQLTQTPPGLSNSIATIVTHVASTEVRVAYLLNGDSIPDNLVKEFPQERSKGRLPIAESETAETLIAKLTKSRSILGDALSRLTEADLTREIFFDAERLLTGRRHLALLSNHQMQHYGQIQINRKFL